MIRSVRRDSAATFSSLVLATACAVLWLAPHSAAQGRSIYVSPTGTAGRSGTITDPISLASALSASGPARPGDTIWLLGGTYNGAFTSTLNGTSSAPIIVRQYPGQRATLDNFSNPTVPTLVVNGSWTTYWGFEIANSYPNRFVNVSGRGTGLDIYGPNTKFINLVIHDAQVGVGFWSPAVNAELYGNIIYNNGIEWTDRGHGHSIYAQNQTGTKRIIDNIMFNGFSFGIHAYTQGGSIDNFVMDGNISFNHGRLSSGGLKSDLLLGGGQVAHNAVITNNHLYNSPGLGGRGADIGYGTPCSAATIQNNSFVGDWALNLACPGSTFSGNQLSGGISFSAGSYPSNTYYALRPTGTWVSVRPNQYEQGRGHIVIYNWTGLAQVPVNLAQAGLASGDSYQIRDVQNYFGSPIAAGVFNGTPVNVPMTSNIVAQPVGNAAVPPTHTSSAFGVFVVMRTSPSSGPPPPIGTLSVSPTSITAGQSASLNWSSFNATSVSIDQGIGTVAASGTRSVNPTATTTYTLTTTNATGQSTTATATLTVSPAPPPPPPTNGSAVFVGSDTTTQGNWRGVYGGDGYSMATVAAALPSYAQVTVGGPSYTWVGSTTETRALLLPTGSVRTAATWYAPQTFNVTVNVTDGQTHQLAVYNLDWDRQFRTQSIELLDTGTGTLLDRRDATNFGNGVYWIWRVGGGVTLRITRTGGPSPVIAGLFFGPTSGTPPSPPPSAPTASLTGNPLTIAAGQSTTLTWSTTNATSVSIDQGIGTVAATGSRVVNPTSNTTYTLRAANATSEATAAVSIAVTTPPPPPPPSGSNAAAFMGTDTTTQGNWRGVYGSDGYSMAASNSAIPGYAQISVGGAAYTWQPSSTEARALLLPTGSARMASTWYGPNSFALDVVFTDAQAHNVALYGLDWDRQGRAQSIEVLDAASSALLDRRDVSAFGNGIYWIWRVSGHVVFRITRTAGPSPVIAGLFLSPATGGSPAPSPTATLGASPATISSGQSSQLNWSSSNAATVSISPGIGVVGSSGSRAVNPTATTTYTLTATNSSGQSTTATATVTVNSSTPPPPSGGASATFVRVDAAVQGNWRGAYGTNGYVLSPANSGLPSYAQFSVVGSSWTWAGVTTEERALLQPTGTSRIAATWYGTTTATLDVNTTDGQAHQLAVYGLDWDRQGRAQTLEIVNAATGAVLDSRQSGAFGDGKYWVWRITGHVLVRVTKTAGPSPAISGVFFDP